MKESEKERKIMLYEYSLKLEYKKKQGRSFFHGSVGVDHKDIRSLFMLEHMNLASILVKMCTCMII